MTYYAKMTFKKLINQYLFFDTFLFLSSTYLLCHSILFPVILFLLFIIIALPSICIQITHYPCRICSKDVNNSNCICCDSCDQWIHRKCSGLSTFQFMQLKMRIPLVHGFVVYVYAISLFLDTLMILVLTMY